VHFLDCLLGFGNFFVHDVGKVEVAFVSWFVNLHLDNGSELLENLPKIFFCDCVRDVFHNDVCLIVFIHQLGGFWMNSGLLGFTDVVRKEYFISRFDFRCIKIFNGSCCFIC